MQLPQNIHHIVNYDHFHLQYLVQLNWISLYFLNYFNYIKISFFGTHLNLNLENQIETILEGILCRILFLFLPKISNFLGNKCSN